ncbi:hypothetical protein HGP14_02770 [Rhizobium sp. P32RR-XVIII]|uniref:hypothetical protein n=1 Tax=Rhizobium sp. P32RR-XVIII TaxID=2726738 RepID=UPI0014565A1C|nr:hypothetical protein [Rhizobium sp. P32RR-XVIII]NLS02292.1 hypothetical protein [Rhizobium sp. P32RR-XVIII]
MPVCSECGDEIETEIADIIVDDVEVQRLYRAVADGAPKVEILQMIYDMFGSRYELAPPSTELRIAQMCGTERASAHG